MDALNCGSSTEQKASSVVGFQHQKPVPNCRITIQIHRRCHNVTGVSTVEPQTAASPPSITAGLFNRSQLAADLKCSERTIIRREHAGMPVIRLGVARFYDPAAVRAWIMSFEHRHHVPKRGRPSKAGSR
jgi:hypothetical protein